MSSKYFVLSLMLALGTVSAGCSGSKEPARKQETKQPSVAGSFSSNAPSSEPAPAVATPDPATPPVQSAPVGVPGPGQVAFGPAPAGSGFRPQGDAEMQRYRETRAQQQAAAAKAAEANDTQTHH